MKKSLVALAPVLQNYYLDQFSSTGGSRVLSVVYLKRVLKSILILYVFSVPSTTKR